jgi:hypothetical protein
MRTIPFAETRPFLANGRPVSLHPSRLGQAITDPKILAKVDLAEAFGNALRAVSQVVQVPPETMATSAETAKMTFKALIKNPSFIGYAMKVLVLSAVVVKADIRALGFTPQQLANILKGANDALQEVVPTEEMPAKLKMYEDEIISRAPANIQGEVKRLFETSGVTPENLAPNMPKEAEVAAETGVVEPSKLSGLEIAALIGVPLAILAAVGIAWK